MAIRLFYVNKLAAKLVATKHNLSIFVVGVITVIVACSAILLLGLISSAVLALLIQLSLSQIRIIALKPRNQYTLVTGRDLQSYTYNEWRKHGMLWSSSMKAGCSAVAWVHACIKMKTNTCNKIKSKAKTQTWMT